MNIDNIAGLVYGELLVKPGVSHVKNFACEASIVKQGDIYVAMDRTQKSVDLAIKNGAYAILYDGELKITDQEIAWIKVTSIEMAMMRLMRFQSAYKKLTFVALSFLQEEILKSFKKKEKLYILPSNVLEAFLIIMNAPDGSFIFCSNESMLQKVSPDHESIWTQKEVQDLSGGSLFISSFIHQDEYYQNIPISPLFIPALCGILSFFKAQEISHSLANFKPLEHFEPLFIDKYFCPKQFGQTRRALIIEQSEALFEHEARNLSKFVSAANYIIVKPKNISLGLEVDYSYVDESYLKMLDRYDFRYALVLGDKNRIEKALIKKNEERYKSLF